MISDLSSQLSGKRMIRKRVYLIASGVSALLLLAVFFRVFGKNVRAEPTEDSSITPAAVAIVKRAPISNKITLSGDFVPFQEVDVHAKVSGYKRKL
jgi:multidrug efflux pump subunit AcrA (membrane-fusion protein)